MQVPKGPKVVPLHGASGQPSATDYMMALAVMRRHGRLGPDFESALRGQTPKPLAPPAVDSMTSDVPSSQA